MALANLDIRRVTPAISTQMGVINVLAPQYGVDLIGGTALARTNLLQSLANDAAAEGLAVRWPSALYDIWGLDIPDNATWLFDGIGKTIFRFSDDAPELNLLLRPATTDGTTRDVTLIGGASLDGNYARPTVTGETYITGAPRPAASCFATAGICNLHIIGGIQAYDGVLHDIDICSGGEVSLDGTTNYVSNENLSTTYYPANMSDGIYIDFAEGKNAGDDCITGHFSQNVYIGHAIGRDPGLRHPTPYASNGVEVDDGCRHWWVGIAEGINANRGVSTKCHSDNPAPYDIHFQTVKVKGCAVSVTLSDPNTVKLDNHNITIGTLIIEDPAQVQTDDPLEVYGMYASGIRGGGIGKIIIVGKGTETFGGLIRSAIYQEDCKGFNIGPGSVKDWAGGNTSITNAGALNLTSTVRACSVGPLALENVGYRAALINNAQGVMVDISAIENPTLLTGSIGVSMGNTSKSNKTRLKVGSFINIETPVQYGSTAMLNPTESMPGNLRLGGFLGFDGANTKTIATDAITLAAGDSSFIRVDTEGLAAADDLSTINGGDALFLMLCCVSNSRAITVKNLVGNIYCGGSDIVLDTANKMLMFYRHSNVWKIINKV